MYFHLSPVSLIYSIFICYKVWLQLRCVHGVSPTQLVLHPSVLSLLWLMKPLWDAVAMGTNSISNSIHLLPFPPPVKSEEIQLYFFFIIFSHVVVAVVFLLFALFKYCLMHRAFEILIKESVFPVAFLMIYFQMYNAAWWYTLRPVAQMCTMRIKNFRLSLCWSKMIQ